MSSSSLPSYPSPRVDRPAARAQPDPPLGSQGARLLAKLALAAGIVALVLWLRWTADRMGRPRPPAPAPPAASPAPRAPVDFEEIEDWYHRTWLFQTRQEVEAEIGPPTERVPWGPELAERMERVEHSNRHRVPADQVWVRWVDPKDPRKSVTVLFAGGRVYDKFKKGF